MACAVDTYALVSLEEALAFLGLSLDDIIGPAFNVWHDESNSRTAATVGLSGTTLTLTSTGGAAPPTYTFDLTSKTPNLSALGVLLDSTNGIASKQAEGWYVEQHAPSDVISTDLLQYATASAFGYDSKQTLNFYNKCRIGALINQVSDAVEALADRKFLARPMTDRYPVYEGGLVQTRNWPIQYIDFLSTGKRPAISLTNATSDAAYCTASLNYLSDYDVLSTAESRTTFLSLQIVGGTSAGEDTESASASTTITELVAAINAAAGYTTAGWVATVQGASSENIGAMPASMLMPAGGLNCRDQTVYLDVPDRPASYFDQDFSRGRFRVHAAPGSEVIVKYAGGFTSLPDDLKFIVMNTISEMYSSEGESIGFASGNIESERLGDYSYSSGTDTTSTSTSAARIIASSPTAMTAINHYRNSLY